MIKSNILLIILFYAFLSQADPAGEIRFSAKVLSSEGKMVEVEASGKKYHVPRSACTADVVVGQQQEIALTPEQYFEMKKLIKPVVKN